MVVVINMHKEPCEVTLRPDEHTIGSYLNLFGASTIQVTPDMQLNLKPWEYLVFTNKLQD